MGITTNIIKKEFEKADRAFEFCWKVLVDIKESNLDENSFGERILDFQGRLATVIFDLQSIRDKILVEQKNYVKNKDNYNFEWFKKRMKLLSNFKEGIDYTVNMSKHLGDAFVHFFYQWDTDLLNDHLNHQKIMNHTASLGERGELEFIKNFKNIGTNLTIFHGITNVLRYGDFSFYDFKSRRIVEIGELKTKKIDDHTVEFQLTLINRKKTLEFQPLKNLPPEPPKDKRERQLRGITKFLSHIDEAPKIDRNLVNNSYSKAVEELVLACSVNNFKIQQVSPGLSFSCVKFARAGLFTKIFKRDKAKVIERQAGAYQTEVLKLMKPGSSRNSIIVGGPLSGSHTEDHSTPGTIPLFWMPMSSAVLEQLYLGSTFIIATFNPVHLIDSIEELGFKVDSKYAAKYVPSKGEKINVIQNFDFFTSYIISHLLTEDFVCDTVKTIKESEFFGKPMKISIRPQQRIQLQKIKK